MLTNKLHNLKTKKKMKNSEQPVYPIVWEQTSNVMSGLTKREYFAGLAMQGLLSNSEESTIHFSVILKFLGLPKDTQYSFEEHYTKYIAKLSIQYADDLLKELEITK